MDPNASKNMKKPDTNIEMRIIDDQNPASKPVSKKKCNKYGLQKFINKHLNYLMPKEASENPTDIEKPVVTTVFVNKIDSAVAEKILAKFFSKFGRVVKAKIYRDSPASNGFKLESKGCGWVKFARESGAVKALAAEDKELSLKSKTMVVSAFAKKEKKKVSTRKSGVVKGDSAHVNVEMESEQIIPSLINSLPIDILSTIFQELCIRDLCIVEQVCKHWYIVAKNVWSTKKKLILTEAKVFEGYTPPEQKDNPYGFKKKLVFDNKSFRQILKKPFGSNLKHLDMSGYAKHFDRQLLKLVIDKCSNLTSLNISSMVSVSNGCARQICSLKNLKELNMSYMPQITDVTVGKIFKKCLFLETINLRFGVAIHGTTFNKAPPSLRSLTIDQCENVDNKCLLDLFAMNTNFEHLSLQNCTQISPEVLLFILSSLPSLKTLNLAEVGFSTLEPLQIEQIDFKHLSHLRALDLNNSFVCITLIQKLLASSTSLQFLNLSYCSRVNDQAFSIPQINSPLVELNLSFVLQVTDATLKSLHPLSKSLKNLKLKGCTKLTNEDITDTMIQLSSLVSLDVRNNFNVNNTLLEAALNLGSDRAININCIDTGVNTIEFEFKYPDAIRKYDDFNHYVFTYKNLTFETNLTVSVTADGDLRIWEENGVLIGANVDSGDEWEDMLNIENGVYDYNLEAMEDYDGDDGDYFDEDNDVPEMFNELDQ